jgi:hypothetical protein
MTVVHYVKQWVCPNCKEVHYSYNFKCAGCGHPRTKDVRWFIPNPPIVATPEQWATMGEGANWFCNHCGCTNPSYGEDCVYCGAERGSSPVMQAQKDFHPDSYPTTPDTAAPTLVSNDQPRLSNPAQSWPVARSSSQTSQDSRSIHRSNPVDSAQEDNWFSKNLLVLGASATSVMVVIGIVLLCVLGFSALWYFVFDTEPVGVMAHSFSWEQYLELDEYKYVQESAWEEDVPSGAENKTCVREKKGTEDVPDGTKEVEYSTTCYETVPDTCWKDTANGGYQSYPCTKTVSYPCTKTRTEPKYRTVTVYGQKCTYYIWKWMHIQTYTTTGQDQSPYYHKNPTVGDKYRTRPREGWYQVHYISEYLDDFSCNYKKDVFQKFEEGQEFTVGVNRLGGRISCPTP